MKKRITSILLALVLCLGLLPTGVLAEELPDASITVPTGAALFIGTKGQVGEKDTHFVAFSEVQPAKSVPNEANGTTTYYFKLSNDKVYNYRVSGESYVTTAGPFKKTDNFALTVDKTLLQPQGVTKTTVDRDPASNGGYNMADVYLNINAQGYLKLAGKGSADMVFTEGESVFDVLLRVCTEQKIHMEFTETPMYQSAYIEGIGNLYEFDCGDLSGWMYRVNGCFPNYGCSQYTLADGDVIEWLYTCDLGKDVGGAFVTQQ